MFNVQMIQIGESENGEKTETSLGVYGIREEKDIDNKDLARVTWNRIMQSKVERITKVEVRYFSFVDSDPRNHELLRTWHIVDIYRHCAYK